MEHVRRHVKVDRRTLAKGGLAGIASATLYRSVAAPVARSQGAVSAAALQAQGLPAGTVLATSPRLPLYGIGASQIPGLVSGGVAD
jgi:hypothetical protein